MIIVRPDPALRVVVIPRRPEPRRTVVIVRQRNGRDGAPGVDSDMLKATYDPRNKAADAFNLANHTGNITSDAVLIDGGLL